MLPTSFIICPKISLAKEDEGPASDGNGWVVAHFKRSKTWSTVWSYLSAHLPYSNDTELQIAFWFPLSFNKEEGPKTAKPWSRESPILINLSSAAFSSRNKFWLLENWSLRTKGKIEGWDEKWNYCFSPIVLTTSFLRNFSWNCSCR